MKQTIKAVATNDGSSKNLTKQTREILTNNSSKINTAIYFSDTKQSALCFHVLPNGSTYFDGIGACPHCYDLTHRFDGSLREHTANYFSNFGGAK